MSHTSKTGNFFVNLETGPPTSLDPLQCDFTNNVYLAFFVHSPILEIAADNSFTSAFFSEIAYFPAPQNKAVLRVKSNLKFSDGTELTSLDIILAITRMLKQNPTFPGIRNIAGVQQWVSAGSSLSKLPSGISSDSGTINIEFDSPLSNPLFRLTLPLFSVIPSHCIDKATSKINCKTFPTAGRYVMNEGSQLSSEITLVRNPHYSGPRERLTSKIEFRTSITDTEALKRLIEQNNIVVSTQNFLMGDNVKSFVEQKLLAPVEMPYDRFFGLLLNPTLPAIHQKECRILFLDTLRSEVKARRPDFDVSPSIIPRILPGFLNPQDFAGSESFSQSTIDECMAKMSGAKLKWAKLNFSGLEFLNESIIATAKQLKINLQLETYPSPLDQDRAFADGDLAFRFTGSGFWALDPLGDIQMLFTPGLHLPFAHVWRNQSFLAEMKKLEHSDDLSSSFTELNKASYNLGLFGILIHSGRQYLTNYPLERIGKVSPFSSSTQPWLYFP